MSWKENTVESERERFVTAALCRSEAFVDVCEQFNIAPKTGYKWLNRYREKGIEGLKDLPKTPHHHRDEITDEEIERLLIIKNAFSKMGPKKVHIKYKEFFPNERSPSPSSIGIIFSLLNLSKARRFRRHVPLTNPLQHCKDVNHVWGYDFKGWFNTVDGSKCEPLTITDCHSRFILKCIHMPRKRVQDVWPVFDSAFREYGLPRFVRSDNGPPFGSTGKGRLTKLSILLIKAGVTPEWISPGKPQENGRHERMHQTLKSEVASPPEPTLKQQLILLQDFVTYFNEDRPHEALNMQVPASVYRTSERHWDGKFRPPEYPNDYILRKVSAGGQINWKGQRLFVGETLEGEFIGITEIDNGFHEVYYGPILLGSMDLKKGQIKRFCL